MSELICVAHSLTGSNFLKHNFNPRSWEWINHKYFVCRERCLSANGKRIISREVITHTEKGVIADQYCQESLKALVSKAGFNDIIIHGALTVRSQRNQDLGMMENRIILSAINNKTEKIKA